MGIYDREYYRREGPSLLGSFTQRGAVCKWLIIINVVCFVLQLLTFQRGPEEPGWFTKAFWLDTDLVLKGQIWRLLTYAFLHDPGSVLHVLFNMLFLWWFGGYVEDHYGPREFLTFYLFAAVLGGLAFQLAGMAGMQAGHICLGASGAVTAVLVLCALHYPMLRIYLWFFIPIPIWAFVLFQVAQDLFSFLGNVNSHTAVAVHLGGAAFAFVYYKRGWRLANLGSSLRGWRLANLWSSLRGWQLSRPRPRLRVYREEPEQPVPVAAPPPAAADLDEHLEAKLDAVLEKVARSGQASLTESERQILLRASEVYKRRRT